MEKDFDKWNTRKKQLHAKERYPSFKEREVWWCHVGTNIGHEIDGTGTDFVRPVLVLRRFNMYVALVLPLTRTKKGQPFYHILRTKRLAESRVVLSQIRLLSSKRLRSLIARVSPSEFREIQDEVSGLIYDGKK
ncbi:MAG: type II toxin-antitoxin system PemK/MazF family toxin [Candidatus Thiodiazotropha sp. (ex Lucinoma borealis)]|nr:type II toxin-antitoxin system PemK/MazF family toxin [Candidatus Thiodiazotropha sp. (ex Lucinoma borealis)]